MTTGETLYLLLVIATFAGFAAMLVYSLRQVGGEARALRPAPRESAPHGAAPTT